MLYNKFIVKLGMVGLDDKGFEQYNRTMDEVDKLCEITKDEWGLIHDPWFDKVRKWYFIAGAVSTCVLSRLFVAYLNSRHNKNKD